MKLLLAAALLCSMQVSIASGEKSFEERSQKREEIRKQIEKGKKASKERNYTVARDAYLNASVLLRELGALSGANKFALKAEENDNLHYQQDILKTEISELLKMVSEAQNLIQGRPDQNEKFRELAAAVLQLYNETKDQLGLPETHSISEKIDVLMAATESNPGILDSNLSKFEFASSLLKTRGELTRMLVDLR